MKFLLLYCCVCIFFSLSSMEHDTEKLPFCSDLISILQKRIFFKGHDCLFFPAKNNNLSSNYAEFDKQRIKEGCQLPNIELAEDSKKSPVFIINGPKNDYLLELNRDHEINFFDGPNKNNVIATDAGCYIFAPLDVYDQKKEKHSHKSRQCWCCDCSVFSPKLKFCFSEYPLIDHAKRVGAVAVHKITNRVAVAYDNVKQQKVIIYNLMHDGRLVHHSELKISLAEMKGCIKKISFLTIGTLLALTDQGELASLALHEDNSITIHWQTMKSSGKDPHKVQDYAVDHYNPKQMVMLLENGRLVFGDLVNCTYTPLSIGIDADVLKFYNDTIAFKERDSEQLTLINLLLVKRYMIERLLAQE